MAFDIENPVGTGTDEEILAFTRAAIVTITMHGQSYGNFGQLLTRANLPVLHKQVEWLEARIAAASGNSVAHNQVRFRRAL